MIFVQYNIFSCFRHLPQNHLIPTTKYDFLNLFLKQNWVEGLGYWAYVSFLRFWFVFCFWKNIGRLFRNFRPGCHTPAEWQRRQRARTIARIGDKEFKRIEADKMTKYRASKRPQDEKEQQRIMTINKFNHNTHTHNQHNKPRRTIQANKNRKRLNNFKSISTKCKRFCTTL
jgi:hypothetical protein